MSSQTTTERSAIIATEIVLPGVGEPETLEVQHRELPAPGTGEVLVRVEASGVSFAETAMRRGRYPGQPRFPFVPGYDLVGSVTTLGPAVTEVTVGQRVAALTKTGGWSDYIVLPAANLVPVPSGLDAAEAETAVVNGATAWQMLHDMAKVRSGQTIVVHGATGGVGVLLVQLARITGARVIGTASPTKHDVVRALGAEPLDYHADDLVAQVRVLAPNGVDAVFDHIGGKSIRNSWRMLGPGGTLVSYSMLSKRDGNESMVMLFILLLGQLYLWNALPNGRHAYFFDVNSGKTRHPQAFHQKLHAALTQVFALLAQGRIQARVASRVPLEQAAEAMRQAESGKMVGKVVLIPGMA
jgi:2-desacetyl-2-hydroxyethyl bacteriochlorophyllide A dehydrogenase